MNQFCPVNDRLQQPNVSAPFRLDHLLIERHELFRWPVSLEPEIQALAGYIAGAVSAGVLADHGQDLHEKAETTARNALAIPDAASIIFGHSAIQILEQLLLTRSKNHPVCTLCRDFFLFDKTLTKLGIAQARFATLDELISKSPPHYTVLLSAPNNPTSLNLSACELERLLREREGLVLVDEAYILFANDPEHRLAFLERYPNLVLLRGTAKSGLAGLGLGYILCHETAAEHFLQTRISSLISHVQAAMATRLFDKYQELRKMSARLAAMRDTTARQIAHETQCRPISGHCDFLLVRTGRKDCREITITMRETGIPALAYERLPGFEDVVKLFPAAYARNDEIVRCLSS